MKATTAAARRLAADVPWHNAVALCGHLTASPEPVDLPSGDPLWRFRVAVERPRAARRGSGGDGRRVVDGIDCSTGSVKVADRLTAAGTGAVVEVSGPLTRRFWRSAGGLASRYEVVVERIKVVRRAPAAADSA